MSPPAEPMAWHDQREVCGFTVCAFFFDGDAAELEPDFTRRMLPVFKTARPRLISAEADRRNFRVSTVVAQPDAVLAHGQGLISLEYKPQDKKNHRRDRWHEDIPVRGMLQCLIAAIAVSAEMHKPTVAVLRCHNALYLLKPYPGVLSKVIQLFDQAPDYWGDYPDVMSSRIAKYCEPWLRDKFPVQGAEHLARQRRGEELHAANLRR
jgi:hypothetical protein